MKALKTIGAFFALWLVLHITALLIIGLNDTAAQADAILIFGNKVETNGEPSERLQSRLDQGLTLYLEGFAPLIIVSGGLGEEGYEEAEIMKSYLIEKGVPESAVIEDKTGNNTYLTAKNLQAMAEEKNIKSIIAVSQYYHLLRARLTLSKFGFNPVYTSPAKMFPEFRDLYSIPREMIGYYFYLFKDYKIQ